MKKLIKLMGIMAMLLLAVSVVACSGGSDDGDDSDRDDQKILSNFDGWDNYDVQVNDTSLTVSHDAEVANWACCGTKLSLGGVESVTCKVKNNAAINAYVKILINKEHVDDNNLEDYDEHMIEPGQTVDFTVEIEKAVDPDMLIVFLNSNPWHIGGAEDASKPASGSITISDFVMHKPGSDNKITLVGSWKSNEDWLGGSDSDSSSGSSTIDYYGYFYIDLREDGTFTIKDMVERVVTDGVSTPVSSRLLSATKGKYTYTDTKLIFSDLEFSRDGTEWQPGPEGSVYFVYTSLTSTGLTCYREDDPETVYEFTRQ